MSLAYLPYLLTPSVYGCFNVPVSYTHLVELVVYDSDGQKGLSVPSSLEMQALNEGMANIGAGLGSSFTVNQNAGAAIVSDLTRGVLQGGSQYLSKKFRTVKVNLKANYKVMLYTKQ